MRNIHAGLLEGLASETYRPCVLLALDDGDEVLRYTTWTDNLEHSSNVYYPRGLDFSAIRYGTAGIVDNVSFKIDDTDRALYAFMAVQRPGQTSATVTLAVVDRYGTIIGATDVFIGSLSEWSYSPASLTCKVSSVFVQWANVSTKVFSGSCRWAIFKGSECKYVGDEAECNRTYSQCELYSNTDNFGGFRWIQSLEDKDEVKTIKNFVRWPTGSGESV